MINELTGFFDGLRRSWGAFLALGIALVALGAMALAMPLATTFASVVVAGWALIFAGVFEVVALLRLRPRRAWLSLLGCGFSIAAGALILRHPGAGAAGLTLLLATVFVASGIYRVVAAASIRLPGWGWSLAGGVVTVALGVLVELSWPLSALWVIGTLVAVDLLSRGCGWVMLAFAARRLPEAAPPGDHDTKPLQAAA